MSLLSAEPDPVIPTDQTEVMMLTASRRYWSDPLYRQNINEFIRLFNHIEQEMNELSVGR